MGTESKKNKTSNKLAAMITYAVALVCMLLGLFLPFAAKAEGAEGVLAAMLGGQLPAAFDGIYKIGESGLQGMFNSPAAAYSFPFHVNHLFETDLASVLLVLYALVVLAGIIALIPVLADTFRSQRKKQIGGITVVAKAEKNIALRAASVIEILSVVTLSAFILCRLNQIYLEGGNITAFTDYALLTAFGGTLLMLIIQSFVYKGGSGFAKFILALFSAVAVILVFGLAFFIPPVAEIEFVSKLNLTLYALDGNTYAILPLINSLFTTGLDMEAGIVPVILSITSVVLGYLILVNLVLDFAGLGKNTNKLMLVCNVVRYALELIATLVIVITVLIVKAGFGNLSIILAVLAAIALIINIVRLATYKTKKKAKDANKAEATEEKRKVAAPVPSEAAAKKLEERKQKAEAKAKEAKEKETAQDPVREQPQYYNPVIYNGPTDDFIKTLPNEQKIEFSQLFFDHANGNLDFIPKYDLGGNNEKFFSSIFIYYGRIRGLVSDELMNAFYKRVNMMN